MRFITENPDILDELAPQAEWDTDHTTAIPQQIEKDIWRHVTAASRKGNLVAMWKPVAVAAAVLSFIIGAFLWMPSAKKEKASLAVHGSVVTPDFDTVVNESNDIHQVVLADGSRISLYAKSSVIYSTGFTNKREIFLTGKAVFHVTKDPHAPFIVYSGGITTTALGTVFMVDAGEVTTAINVQLYEGKVVIRSVDTKLAIADTYLLPGEQCNVNMALALVKVSKIPELPADNNNRSMLAKTVKDHEAEQLALDFEKIPLTATFERLQRIFGKEIVFNSNEITRDLFTGHFDKSDSLLQILQIVAVMNGLQVQQEGDVFRLSKKAAMANTTPVKVSPETSDAAAPVPVATPPVIPPAVIENKVEPVQADSNGMRIVDVPTGKDYRKVPLSMVFDQIAKTNNVIIKYQQEQLQDLYFTGTIPNDHSSIDMLPVLCRMNGLKLLKKKGGEYTVRPATQ